MPRSNKILGRSRMPWIIIATIMMSGCAATVRSHNQVTTETAQGCTVTRDNGTKFTDTSVNSCSAYYPAMHICSRSGDTRPAICSVQDMFRAIDWHEKTDPYKSEVSDLINNVKKGLWSAEFEDTGNGNGPITHDRNSCFFPLKRTNPLPINSLAAMFAATKAGFQSVELDTVLLWNASTTDLNELNNTNSRPMIGHSNDFWAFTDYAGPHSLTSNDDLGGYIWNTTPAALDNYQNNHGGLLRMMRIDGGSPLEEDCALPSVPGTYDNCSWLNTVDAIRFLASAKAPVKSPFIVLDPKPSSEQKVWIEYDEDDQHNIAANFSGKPVNNIGRNGCSSEYKDDCNKTLLIHIIKSITNQLIQLEQSEPGSQLTAYVAIKTSLDYNIITNEIEGWEKFSWVPLAQNNQKDPDAYLTYLENWRKYALDNVLFIDTNINGPDWWQAQPFTWDGTIYTPGGDPQSEYYYRDVTDYIRKEFNRRAQFWSPVAQTPRGTILNYANSPQFRTSDALLPSGPNAAKPLPNHSFFAPDPSAHLTEAAAAWAVVTTDRPDMFLQMRNKSDVGRTTNGKNYGCRD